MTEIHLIYLTVDLLFGLLSMLFTLLILSWYNYKLFFTFYLLLFELEDVLETCDYLFLTFSPLDYK